MINAEQIRAARALLDWSTAELAKQAGLTVNGINKIERGHVQAHRETVEKLQEVLEKSGVEFMDFSGVRLKPQGVEILLGQKGLQKFFDGVYEYVKEHGGTIVQLGIQEDLFWAMGVEFSEAHRKRMTEMIKERKDIKVLAILCEGDTNFIASEYNQYRWISKELFSAVPFYIYGDYLAIMNFQTVPSPTIILHKFSSITNAYRKQFEAFWNMSREPDTKEKK